jgi:hypothetical protein
VNQCPFLVAPGRYTNKNSDEDDWQGWGIRKEKLGLKYPRVLDWKRSYIHIKRKIEQR